MGGSFTGLDPVSSQFAAAQFVQSSTPAMVLADPREVQRLQNRINDPVLAFVDQGFAAAGNASRAAGNAVANRIELTTSGFGGTTGDLLAGFGGGLAHFSRTAGNFGAVVDAPRTLQAIGSDIRQSFQIGVDQGVRLGFGRLVGTNQLAQAFVGNDFNGQPVDFTTSFSEGLSRLSGTALSGVGSARLLRPTPSLGNNVVSASISPSARSLPQLNVLNPTFVPNTQRVLQRVTNQAYADIAANPTLARRLLKPREFDQLRFNGRFADAQFGNAIERRVARIIRGDSSLNSILIPSSPARFRGRFVRSNDFVGIEQQHIRGFDLTTIGQVPAKLNRPGAGAVEFVIQPGRGAIQFK